MHLPTKRWCGRCAGDAYRYVGLELAMNARPVILLAAGALLVAPVARSGHEQPVYPSYYPHEIEVRSITPGQAADLLRSSKLHAYIGPTPPPFVTPPPEFIGSIQSLSSFVVVEVSPLLVSKDQPAACKVAQMVVRDLTEKPSNLIFHPYPVTPLHGDYLHHADLADAAKMRLRDPVAGEPAVRNPKVIWSSRTAKILALPESLPQGMEWDAIVHVIDAAGLIASNSVVINDWRNPPWTRSGWFYAYHLLADRSSPDQRVLSLSGRLHRGDHDSPVERINLERDLVRALTASCRMTVAGYTVKREYFNTEFSAGIENIGFDALEGLLSPIFVRTVKLKDFPWNGWLQLGVGQPPAAAWNPIGGFTDDFGRLMWFAVGDAAAIPSPYDQAWMLNRFSEVEQTPRPSPKE